MREFVTVGPFGIQFTNKNTTHNLKTHSHYAEVSLRYESRAGVGFPSFKATHDVLADELRRFTARPFADHTNERLTREILAHFAAFTHPDIEDWGGDYALQRVTLRVQGVHDIIGHAPGMTTYEVEL